MENHTKLTRALCLLFAWQAYGSDPLSGIDLLQVTGKLNVLEDQISGMKYQYLADQSAMGFSMLLSEAPIRVQTTDSVGGVGLGRVHMMLGFGFGQVSQASLGFGIRTDATKLLQWPIAHSGSIADSRFAFSRIDGMFLANAGFKGIQAAYGLRYFQIGGLDGNLNLLRSNNGSLASDFRPGNPYQVASTEAVAQANYAHNVFFQVRDYLSVAYSFETNRTVDSRSNNADSVLAVDQLPPQPSQWVTRVYGDALQRDFAILRTLGKFKTGIDKVQKATSLAQDFFAGKMQYEHVWEEENIANLGFWLNMRTKIYPNVDWKLIELGYVFPADNLLLGTRVRLEHYAEIPISGEIVAGVVSRQFTYVFFGGYNLQENQVNFPVKGSFVFGLQCIYGIDLSSHPLVRMKQYQILEQNGKEQTMEKK